MGAKNSRTAMAHKTRSEALDEAVIQDVTWRFEEANEALDNGRFVTALDYIRESGELVKAAIARHDSEFLAATPVGDREHRP